MRNLEALRNRRHALSISNKGGDKSVSQTCTCQRHAVNDAVHQYQDTRSTPATESILQRHTRHPVTTYLH